MENVGIPNVYHLVYHRYPNGIHRLGKDRLDKYSIYKVLRTLCQTDDLI